MPRHYRTTRRRPYRRVKRRMIRRPINRGLRTSVRKFNGVVPDMLRLKLKYTYQATLTSGVTNYVENVFRANSIFDPDATGVGGQPMGHDQWANFYNVYRVYASKIVVSFDSEDTSDGLIGGVVPTNNSTPFSSAEQALETLYGRKKTMGVSTGINRVVVGNYMETSKIKGVKAINYTPEYSATFGANPNSQWYWHVYVTTTDGSSFPNANVVVTIWYYVELFDRVTLAVS